MSRDPWLSVVVPVFNGERYLDQALQSVLSQADEQTELIIADDGSSDGSVRIAAKYATHPGVEIISGPGSGNWVANSNRAVERACGRYVAFLHQDDLWLPGRLKSIHIIVAAQPDCSMWVGPSRFIDSDGRRVGTWNLPFGTAVGGVDTPVFLEHLLVQNFIAMPAPVFPRAAFERAGGMDESLWFTADWDLWLKLGSLGSVGLYRDALTAFRLHPQSQTMTGAAEHDSMRTQIDTVRSRYIERLPDSRLRRGVEQAGRLSSEVNSGLAALVSGQGLPWGRLLTVALDADWDGYRRFLRDSRIIERSTARLRVALRAQAGAK